MRVLLRCGLTLALLAPLALPAQSPTDRAMLAAWDDSLQHLATKENLSQFSVLAGAVTSEAKNVRRSLFQARSAEVRDDRTDAELALDNLAIDMSEHPKWPWPRLAIARILIRFEIDRRALLPNKVQRAAEPYLTSGWRYLRETLLLDPNFRPAAHFAVDMLVHYGDRTLRTEEVDLLLQETRRPLPDPDALLVLGRHMRTLRRYDSAQKLFTKSVFAGGDRSRLALERARTFLAQGDSASATTAYWDGLEALTPTGRELYHFDLAWIISPDSLASFDELPAADVAAWMHRFWNERDAASANAPGDRVLEHLRRWVVAYSQYRELEPWNRTAYSRVEFGFDNGGICLGNFSVLQELMKYQPAHADDARSREFLLDHRGIVYLRHGEPARRVGSRAFNAAPLRDPSGTMRTIAGVIYAPAIREPRTIALSSSQETWVYWIEGAWRALSFRGSLAMGSYAATTLEGFLQFDFNAYLAVGQFIPAYARGASSIADFYAVPPKHGKPLSPLACNEKDIRTVVKISRNDAMVARNNDSDSPPIDAPWAAVIRSYALGRGDDHTGKALITFAIGTKDLVESSAPGERLVFPVSVRVVAYQSSPERTIQIDTIKNFVTPTRNGWVSGTLEMPLPGGEWQIAVYARQAATAGGSYTLRRGLQIDSVATLTLSDIVTGRADATGWRAPDGQLFPVNPLGIWSDKGVADLYYEVRGLTDGTAYTTTIQVKEIGAKGKPALDLKTADQATGALTPVRKHLALEKLKPGTYEVILSVSANGKKAERTTTIRVIPP